MTYRIWLCAILAGVLCWHRAGMAMSIVFPAFGAPLVTADAIYSYHTYGERLICLNRTGDAVQWQIEAPGPIESIFLMDSNTMGAVHGNRLSVISLAQGKILKTEDLGGAYVGRSAEGNILSLASDNVVVSSEFPSLQRKWEYPCHEKDSIVSATMAGDLIFLSFSPHRIRTESDGKSKRVTMDGTNMIACLSAVTGERLWIESVPLDREEFGVELKLSSGPKWLLCATQDDLRLVDKKSGQVSKRWHSEKDMDGADFYHDGRIAVCFGGIGATTRTIQLLDARDFRSTGEFTVEALEVASVQVIGDVMVLSSLYRDIGVDLPAQKTIWQKAQRHCTLEGELLYFGEHADNMRVLGVCDPKTGHDTVLYSERIEDSPRRGGAGQGSQAFRSNTNSTPPSPAPHR